MKCNYNKRIETSQNNHDNIYKEQGFKCNYKVVYLNL